MAERTIDEARIVAEFCELSIALGVAAGSAWAGNQPKVYDILRMIFDGIKAALIKIGVSDAGIGEVHEAFVLGHQQGETDALVRHHTPEPRA